MPGYADWRTLYHDEYRQLAEEGYQPKLCAAPAPQTLDENAWQQAYVTLIAVRAQGRRADWPYEEPDDCAAILAAASEVPALAALNDSAYAARIRGAWFGRCGGVVLGKPLEMHWDRQQIEAYLRSLDAYPLADWVPARSDALDITLRSDCLPSTRGQVAYVQPDDDIHYTVLSLLLAEEKGLDFTTLDVGMNLLDKVPIRWLWGADYQAYYHLVVRLSRLGESDALALDDIPTTLNPWREWIDGQLKADFWGYIFPAQPRAAAALIYRQAAFSLTKNGIYGGMFVAACISAALSVQPSVDLILDSGLAVIPQRSRLAEAVRKVRSWYTEERDWIATCDRIAARYGHLHFADQINNLAMVTLALLHGELDYTRSITTAVMAGMDVDCNAATVGSIVGAAVGYAGLDPHWIAPLNDTVRTVVADFGSGSISELVERTIRFREQMLKET
jgi:ADP-ribosylglycohydrolase